ncbi:hypothetical protein [Candidatus Flexifilum breve]|uniref:hypothetical protein n=1 Tax=Candidatus Flexifilum breve TaxID=3140694 RepID=UPI0031CC7371
MITTNRACMYPIQHPQSSAGRGWRKQYGKPIVDDELEYEGNIFYPWGGISAEEEVHRFWLMVLNGYAGHTFRRYVVVVRAVPCTVKAGSGSPSLRQLVEAAPGGLSPEIDADPEFSPPHQPVAVDRFAGGFAETITCSTAEYQPRTLLWLPPDDRYQFELIDTWEMTITPAVVRRLDALPSYGYPAPGRPEPEVEMPGKIRRCASRGLPVKHKVARKHFAGQVVGRMASLPLPVSPNA